MIYDFCVVGGGIVGLATAMRLTRVRPGASLLLIEKEAALARHQTGHNSGVIHSGIYYRPGSLKAELCRRGAKATKAFCTEHGIPFEERGKLVVATSSTEMERLAQLAGRARENGIAIEELDAAELTRREPNVTGRGAIYVPGAAIVDYKRVCEAMAQVIRAAGATIRLDTGVEAIKEDGNGVTVIAGEARFQARHVIACAGLQSDRLARRSGIRSDLKIVPFRGEYYDIVPEKRGIVRHLIYPVPDPALPFLGIHLTPMVDGGLTVGPNAVLSLSREGYRPGSFDLADVASYATFAGFWRVIAVHWRSALSEMRNSLSKRRYLAECRKYCPVLEERDLVPREPGIRAQAVLRGGVLEHDFKFLSTARTLHVANAPSPAATSAIPIGEMIVDQALGLRAAQP
ncbi:MAG TPA: L-2-hydroxyglutarate oxidase [Dongiaceae bacterium]|nr:L-2-hydroxyglutarate oxidase [Dongiaceae bacterium]